MPWVVDMIYRKGKAVYPSSLSKSMRSRVHHDVSDGNVTCLLRVDKDKSGSVPGARWVDVFKVVDEKRNVGNKKVCVDLTDEERSDFYSALGSIISFVEDESFWNRVSIKFSSMNPNERENDDLFRSVSVLRDKLIDMESNIIVNKKNSERPVKNPKIKGQ